VRHIPEGFHADRLLRLIAVSTEDAAPRQLASTRLGHKLVAGSRTGNRQGGAPVIILGVKRHK